MTSNPHTDALSVMLDALGITPDILARKRLPAYQDAPEVVVAETDVRGVAHRLIPQAAIAWRAMKQAAHNEGIVIEIVSAFRDIHEQAAIIRDKLERGMGIETILALSAPPGYSEHHTGRAVDINTPGCEPREEPFERTDAFRWLLQHAPHFRFGMSYPRGNALGFIYEPWHWCYQPLDAGC